MRDRDRIRQQSLSAAAAFLFAFPWLAFASEKPVSAEELAKRAIKVNPAIQSINKQIEALGHKIDSVQVWVDPVLAVDYVNVPWDSWSLGDTPMSGLQIKLKQKFPLPGKNARREAVAIQEREVKKWELAERKNKLAAMVKKAYWKLTLVRKLRKITVRHIGLVDQFAVAVRAKYQVGKSGQHELLRLEVLKKKLSDDLGDFDRQDKQLTSVINASLHHKKSMRIITPNIFARTQPQQSLTDLLKLAHRNRPLLKQAQAQSDWHRKAAQAQTFERWPDITLWAGYRFRTETGANPGKDFFSVGLAIPLPFDYTNRFEAQAAMHLSQAGATDDGKRSLEDGIRAQLESSLAAWERAVEKSLNYQKKLLPEAEMILKATLAAYQTDRADFASLYQAELQLLDFQRAIQIADATTQIERVGVEFEVGTPIHHRGQ